MGMKNTPFILLCLSALLVIIPSELSAPAENIFLAVIKPVINIRSSPAIQPSDSKDKSTRIKDKAAILEDEITDLKNEIIQLTNENKALARKLKAATDFMDGQSATKIKDRYELVSADVLINYDAGIWRRSFLINRGSNDGLRDGLPVVHGRYLVGKTSNVAGTYSRVQLVTDPAFRCKVLVVPPPRRADKTADDKASAIPQPGAGALYGISFNKYNIKWIPRDVKVKPGWDIISSSDMENIFPRSLILGKVQGVSEDGHFYTLSGEPPVDFYNLDNVIVLKPRK